MILEKEFEYNLEFKPQVTAIFFENIYSFNAPNLLI